MTTHHQLTAQARIDTVHQALTQLASDHHLLQTATGHIRRPNGLPTPERIAAAGAAWADERADTLAQLARGLKPLGASPAPAGVDLVRMSVLDDVEGSLAELEEAVIDRVAPTLAATDSVPRRVATIVKLLPKVGALPDLLAHVRAEARRMHARVLYGLGESHEVRTLAARCPYCRARSLREIVGKDLVVCVNAMCRCVDDLCGCGQDTPTRHQWYATEWRTPTMEMTA